MGRKIKYPKVAYLAFDDLKISYSPIEEINSNNSSTKTVIIALSCLFGVLVVLSVGLSFQRYIRIPKFKSFNDKKRADLEIKLKDFSVDF